MHQSVRDFVLSALFVAEKLSRPSFHHLMERYDQWERRAGFQRGIQRLERKGYLRQLAAGTPQRCQLTAAGFSAVLNNLDPPARWSRPWDGDWWLVVFDLPAKKKALRAALRKWLCRHRFGCLQGSLWVRPDPPPDPPCWVAEPDQTRRLVMFQAQLRSAGTARALVAGAWDFEEINRRYEVHMAVCRELGCEDVAVLADLEEIEKLVRLERQAWESAGRIDPFLPACLLPANYLGRKAWELRNRVFGLTPQKG